MFGIYNPPTGDVSTQIVGGVLVVLAVVIVVVLIISKKKGD